MKKENQRQIKSIEGVRRVKAPRVSERLLDIKPLAETISTKPSIGRLVSQVAKGGLTVLVSVVIIFTVVKAGSLTPSSAPTPDGYTLGNIYTRLTDNTASISSGSFSMDPSGSPAGTQYTLDQIYSAVPTINPSKLLSDTTYLGVKGSIATQTLSVLNDTVAAGYYAATTLSAVDTDLAAANILSGKTIFGFGGTIIPNPTYGDNDATQVLNTASNPGTYDPNTCSTTYDTSNLTVGTVKSGTAFGDSLTGELTPDGGIATVADLFNGKTAHLTVDWNLDEGTLDLACNTAVFDGDANKVTDAYDGDGSGVNRWCMKETGDAVEEDILSTKKAWVDGLEITGNIANCSSEGSQSCYTTGTYYAGTQQSINNTTTSQSAGYYPVFDLVTNGDADLAKGNILSGVNIFGVVGNAASGYTYGDEDQSKVLITATGAGIALKDLWNGTGQGFTGGSQANGGVDDYNAGSGRPGDAYSKGWTACDTGNDYCGTDDTFADAKDDSTGLIWSKPCSGTGCSTFAEPADTDYEWIYADDADNDGKSASVLCSQTVDAGSPPTTPAAHGAGWSLPHQKQLMQAYINGSYGDDALEASGVARGYWSGTTKSTGTTYAWYTGLSNGTTSTNLKTYSLYVRCVR